MVVVLADSKTHELTQSHGVRSPLTQSHKSAFAVAPLFPPGSATNHYPVELLNPCRCDIEGSKGVLPNHSIKASADVVH